MYAYVACAGKQFHGQYETADTNAVGTTSALHHVPSLLLLIIIHYCCDINIDCFDLQIEGIVMATF